MKINVKYNYKEKKEIRTYFSMSLFVFNFSNYQAKKAEDENTFPNLFKNNFEIDLKNADYDSLANISKMLSSKLEEVQELMKKQKMSKIAELEAQLKELRERDF